MNENKFRSNNAKLGIIILLVGDFFFFGPLLFKNFMIDFYMMLSPSLGVSDLNNAGNELILFSLGTLGSLLYLAGLLVFALSKENAKDQRKWALIALEVWFIADTIASLVFSFGFNAISNIGFLLIGLYFLLNTK